MVRARRQAREAALPQHTADMAFRHRHLERLRDDALKVDAAPAHHAVLGNVGAFFDKRIEFLELCLAEPARTSRTPPVEEPVWPSSL